MIIIQPVILKGSYDDDKKQVWLSNPEKSEQMKPFLEDEIIKWFIANLSEDPFRMTKVGE